MYHLNDPRERRVPVVSKNKAHGKLLRKHDVTAEYDVTAKCKNIFIVNVCVYDNSSGSK